MTPFLLYEDLCQDYQSVPLSASVQWPRLLPKGAERPGGTEFPRGRASSSEPGGPRRRTGRAQTQAPTVHGPHPLGSLQRPQALAEPEDHLQQFLQKAAELQSAHTTALPSGTGAGEIGPQSPAGALSRRRGSRGSSPLQPAGTAAATAATIATVDPDSRCGHHTQGHLPLNADRPGGGATRPGPSPPLHRRSPLRLRLGDPASP